MPDAHWIFAFLKIKIKIINWGKLLWKTKKKWLGAYHYCIFFSKVNVGGKCSCNSFPIVVKAHHTCLPCLLKGVKALGARHLWLRSTLWSRVQMPCSWNVHKKNLEKFGSVVGWHLNTWISLLEIKRVGILCFLLKIGTKIMPTYSCEIPPNLNEQV